MNERDEELLKMLYETDTIGFIRFLIYNAKLFEKLIKNALDSGLTKENYIMICEEMWNMCPMNIQEK